MVFGGQLFLVALLAKVLHLFVVFGGFLEVLGVAFLAQRGEQFVLGGQQRGLDALGLVVAPVIVGGDLGAAGFGEMGAGHGAADGGQAREQGGGESGQADPFFLGAVGVFVDFFVEMLGVVFGHEGTCE